MCRYELWCIARAAAARYCVLQCSAPEDAARAWNAARPAQQAYSEAVFKDLWSRYEEPDSRNRWDKPLFRVNGLEPEEADSVLQVGLQLGLASPSPAPLNGQATPRSESLAKGGCQRIASVMV